MKSTEALFITESLRQGALLVKCEGRGRRKLAETNSSWANYCEQLLAPADDHSDMISGYFAPLSTLERIYAASMVYALAQPPKRRKRLAMFFTPPALSEYVLDRVEQFGVDFRSARFVDPAAGGASFIGPIAHRKRARGVARRRIPGSVLGVEIDPGLADFARAAASAVVGIKAAGMVETGDGLKVGAEGSFDCVIGNPPYRVLTPRERARMPDWAGQTLGRYANLYALFILRSLNLLRDGGVMALLIPTSFITGMYFASLRAHISGRADILAIDTIARRKAFFRDVSQDVCLLVCRKTRTPRRHRAATRRVADDLSWSDTGWLEIPAGEPGAWVVRARRSDTRRRPTLVDYGYAVTCGSIVHNRDTGLFQGIRRRRAGAVPLVWGHVIKPGAPVAPASRNTAPGQGQITFASTDRASPPVCQPSIVLQRTTSADQARRIRASIVDQAWIDAYGGFYGENHVVVISPIADRVQCVDLSGLWRILSSSTVDARLRPHLSSNSVNITALRKLDLPDPGDLKVSWLADPDDAQFEAALKKAYGG